MAIVTEQDMARGLLAEWDGWGYGLSISICTPTKTFCKRSVEDFLKRSAEGCRRKKIWLIRNENRELVRFNKIKSVRSKQSDCNGESCEWFECILESDFQIFHTSMSYNHFSDSMEICWYSLYQKAV